MTQPDSPSQPARSVIVTTGRSCEREITRELMPLVRLALQKFDGKVYNKRFRTHLDTLAQEKGGERPDLYFTCELSMNCKRLFVHGHKRSAPYGVSAPILCTIELDEGRIRGDQAQKSCSQQYAEIMKQCSEIETALHEMGAYVRQLDELHRLNQQVKKNIPSRLYYAFDIQRVMEYGAGWVFPEMRETT